MARFVVGSVSSMPPGTQHRVEAGGRAIAIFNVRGEFFALRDICPHQGAALSAGVVMGDVRAEKPGAYTFLPGRRIRCPWHGWEYDLATGRSSHDPVGSRVKRYDVSVEPGASAVGATRVPGPYLAETVPVSIEGEYVVVEV